MQQLATFKTKPFGGIKRKWINWIFNFWSISLFLLFSKGSPFQYTSHTFEYWPILTILHLPGVWFLLLNIYKKALNTHIQSCNNELLD